MSKDKNSEKEKPSKEQSTNPLKMQKIHDSKIPRTIKKGK